MNDNVLLKLIPVFNKGEENEFNRIMQGYIKSNFNLTNIKNILCGCYRVFTNNPNFVHVIKVTFVKNKIGRAFQLVEMSKINDTPLRSLLDENKLTSEDLRTVFNNVCSILKEVNKMGKIHGDPNLKNILVNSVTLKIMFVDLDTSIQLSEIKHQNIMENYESSVFLYKLRKYYEINKLESLRDIVEKEYDFDLSKQYETTTFNMVQTPYKYDVECGAKAITSDEEYLKMHLYSKIHS